METVNIEIDRSKARELYREYQKHLHYSTPIDEECRRAYKLLSTGRLVIRALESVQAAGVYSEGVNAGFPKLALCRADAPNCRVSVGGDGSLTMHAGDMQPYHRRNDWSQPVQSKNVFWWPAGSFPVHKPRKWQASALLPTPPLHLRPKRGLANYHVLWEAEWTHVVPHDPMLLRRIGRGDMWVVVAMWELTPVERAALATRITA